MWMRACAPQVSDVFVTELKRATSDVGAQLPSRVFLTLFEPFLLTAAAGSHRPTRSRVVDHVLAALIDSVDSFPLANVTLLLSTLFDVATAVTTREACRKGLFALHRRLKLKLRGRRVARKGRLVPDDFDEADSDNAAGAIDDTTNDSGGCLLYTSPSPRDRG